MTHNDNGRVPSLKDPRGVTIKNLPRVHFFLKDFQGILVISEAEMVKSNDQKTEWTGLYDQEDWGKNCRCS